MRTTKGGIVYYLNGTQILGESNQGNITLYLYDAFGAPIGFQHLSEEYGSEWDVYWYEKNLQGDIVAVYDEMGVKLVSYVYDAFGNATITYHNGGASTTVVDNPFRYRGYYYDIDLGLYYLQTRYYDPVIGRFISPDSYASTGTGILGCNMYAYCENNPVMYSDPSGEIPLLVGALIVIGISTIVTGIASAIAYTYAEEVYEQYADVIEIKQGAVSGYTKVAPWHILPVSSYIRYHTDAGAQGTSYGLAIEWGYHAIGARYDLPGSAELNFGKTIVADFNSHKGMLSIIPLFMNATELVTNPFMYIYDVVRYFQ